MVRFDVNDRAPGHPGGRAGEPVDGVAGKGARTRLRILNAAARVLRERGYAATRLSDIAEVAGLRTGSLAFHFPAKADLLDEVLRHGLAAGLAQVRAAVDTLGPGAAPAARVAAALDVHLASLDGSNDYALAILRLAEQFPAEARHRLRDVDRDYVGYWTELLRAARPDLYPGNGPAAALPARLWLGALNATLGRPDTGPRQRVAATALALLGLPVGGPPTTAKGRAACPAS